MAKKLLIDLDEIRRCEQKLVDSRENLIEIQDNLQKAMEVLISGDGWKSGGSAAFYSKYEASWIEGIDDRTAVIQRMIEHLQTAHKNYEPVVKKAEALKIDL